VRAGLYNLSLHNTREDIIRAFLEGIAFNTRWLLKPVEKFLGRKVESINIVGGGAQSDVWCQIFADAMNVEIGQVNDPIYANARGAAWIAAVGWARFPSEMFLAWWNSSGLINQILRIGRSTMTASRSSNKFTGK